MPTGAIASRAYRWHSERQVGRRVAAAGRPGHRQRSIVLEHAAVARVGDVEVALAVERNLQWKAQTSRARAAASSRRETGLPKDQVGYDVRSEEHTSELQS